MFLSLLLRASHNIIPAAHNMPQNTADIQSCAVPISPSLKGQQDSIYHNSTTYPISYVGTGLAGGRLTRAAPHFALSTAETREGAEPAVCEGFEF